MKRHLKLLSCLLAPGMLWAADTSGLRLESPVLGYVFDEAAQSIRTVHGIPGAASLGEAVEFPTSLASAHLHSGARLALAVTKEGQVVLASRGSGIRLSNLATDLRAPGQVAFSGSGGRVAFSSGAVLEVWSTGTSPERLRRFEAEAELTGLAVNDSGEVAALLASGRIVRFREEAEPFAAGSDWSALDYTSDGSAVIAADSLRGELVRLSGDGGRSVLASVTGRVSVIQGEYALTASGLAWLSSGGSAVPVACDCHPQGLDRLAGATYIRGTSLVVDAEGNEPRLTALPNLFPNGVNQ